MIASVDSLPAFERMLADAHFDAARPEARLAWRVFKAFAATPVECADDALLFQCGTYSFTGEPLFQVDFTRQFIHENDCEYDHMEQLHCTLCYAPREELRGMKANLWSSDFPSLD